MANFAELMNTLVDRRAHAVPAHCYADILDQLIWLVDDNGHEIVIEQRNWLQGDDRFRVEVALHMSEVFPCRTREDLEATLDRVRVRWPEFEARCRQILQSWDATIRE